MPDSADHPLGDNQVGNPSQPGDHNVASREINSNCSKDGIPHPPHP